MFERLGVKFSYGRVRIVGKHKTFPCDHGYELKMSTAY